MASLTTTEARQQFEALVKRAEAEVAANPGRYKRRLAALVALGYLVIFLMLAVLVGLLGGTLFAAFWGSAVLVFLVKSKLIFAIVMPIWVLGRSLFSRIKAPDGRPLDRKDFPELWRDIDELRAHVGKPTLHRVVLVPEMNAAVSQTPRLGIFGPYKTTLILGLELLMSLSREQARAVLAHEFGHLSGQDGRFANWIYRKRLTWSRIQASFESQRGFSNAPIRRFMSWYVPKLAGYSFALARQQEYDADAVASRLTSPAQMSSALVWTSSRSQITSETFWKPLIQRANSQPEPEGHVYSKLMEHLKGSPDANVANEKIAEAMRQRTDYADTHPALKDRLAALKAPPQALTVAPVTAAEAWLGANLQKVVGEFDQTWMQSNEPEWAARHKFAQAAMDHLNELAHKPTEQLSQAEAWQLATLTEEFRPEIDPLPLYQSYRAKFADDGNADLAMGRRLLSKHNHFSSVEHLERAADANPMHVRAAAFYLIAAYFARNSHHELSDAWLLKAEQAGDESADAYRERNNISSRNQFKSSRLNVAALAGVKVAILQSPVGGKIKRLWIVEKQVRRFPEAPVHVVLYKSKLFARGKKDLASQLVQELEKSGTLKGHLFCVPDVRVRRALAKKIKAAAAVTRTEPRP
jgi:Zn-dependent protease with chaperone function